MPDLNKVRTLFMSDPATFICLFGALVIAVAGFVWWFRGYLDKERLETANLRLELARDQEKFSTTQLETAKSEIQELRGRLNAIPIDAEALGINDLASGTALALDQALAANKELRSALGFSNDLSSIYSLPVTLLSRWFWKGAQKTWQDRISGCFGDKDGWFAIHPLDEKRAKALIKEAKADGASREDLEKELEKYLSKHTTAKDGIREDLVRNAKKTLRQLW